jgi:hypothetical protein
MENQLGAADQKEDNKAIYAAAENAISRRLVDKTRMLGFGIEKAVFSELPPEGAILVGFDLGIGNFMDIETIYALRAVYRTEDGEASYGEHGLFKDKHTTGKRVIKSKVLRTMRVRARPGYAVGGLTIRSGLNINGLSIMFMRINGATLDPRQTYESDWIGDRTGGSEASISGDGAPVVGVFGNKDQDHVIALGLTYIRQPRREATPPPAAAGARKAVAEKPEAPKPEKPKAEPQVENKPAPPADPIERVINKYRDHEHHFAFTIPDGWKRFPSSELDRIHAALRERSLGDAVHYEAGFRPGSASSGSYPYVLVQVIPVNTAGMTYKDIQRTLDLGIDGPIKTVEGKFSDILSNSSAGVPVLDKGRDRIVLRIGMDVFSMGRIEGLSVMHLGSEGIVAIHGYATESKFETYVPVFTDMNNSFEFEDGYDFVAAKEATTNTWFLPILVFGLVSAPLGIAFLAFSGLKRRAAPSGGKVRQAPEDEEPLDVLPAGPAAPQAANAIRAANDQDKFQGSRPARERAVD